MDQRLNSDYGGGDGGGGGVCVCVGGGGGGRNDFDGQSSDIIRDH